MKIKTTIWTQDNTFVVGLVLFIFSVLCFFGAEQFGAVSWNGRPSAEWFFLHYLVFVIYFFVVGFNNKIERGRFFKFANLRHNIMLLLLANISCYALNREITIFPVSTDWLSVYLVILNAGLLLFSFKKHETSSLLSNLLIVLFSTGVFFNLYESIYILPACVLGVIGFWFFGITLHTFIPLWFLILLSKIVKKYVANYPALKFPALAGFLIPFFIVAGMTIRWHQINHYISDIYRQDNVQNSEIELPYWVRLGQRLEYNWLTDRVLKSDWLYHAPDWLDGIDEAFNARNKEHDPFVVVASWVTGNLYLENNVKGKIYSTLTNNRHTTETRLWSGNNLRTKNISTQVQLMPDFRLAYTEKVFTIKNKADATRFNRPQEAIYTFHLPEGSVVTSASLWVNGEESPAYLTTKSKAEKAYKTIVGVERRDPLLVQWQEGNQMTARIFPCTVEEDRIFKIGITTPMRYSDGELTYQNIDFQGPSWMDAEEDIQVKTEGSAVEIDPSLWMTEDRQGWSWSGDYVSDWSITMPAPPLSEAVFSFNNQTYQAQLYEPVQEKFEAKTIYLDINQDWSGRDFEKIWAVIKDKEVYVFTNQLHRMTAENKDELFDELQDLRYSIFPIYKIKKPEQSLLISAYGALTPALDDLKNSVFARKMQTFLTQQNQAIRVFNFGQELTPYLKTLKETRIIQETGGDLSDLLRYLQESTFPKQMENLETIVLDKTAMKIMELPHSSKTSTAPDHLMRLFVYNDLMRNIGRSYYQQDYITDFLIGEAKEAYVLSPISSLITLETKEDYERFDIHKSTDSLGNASWDSAGSVPEPHEWILLILSGFLIVYLRREQIMRWRFGGYKFP